MFTITPSKYPSPMFKRIDGYTSDLEAILEKWADIRNISDINTSSGLPDPTIIVYSYVVDYLKTDNSFIGKDAHLCRKTHGNILAVRMPHIKSQLDIDRAQCLTLTKAKSKKNTIVNKNRNAISSRANEYLFIHGKIRDKENGRTYRPEEHGNHPQLLTLAYPEVYSSETNTWEAVQDDHVHLKIADGIGIGYPIKCYIGDDLFLCGKGSMYQKDNGIQWSLNPWTPIFNGQFYVDENGGIQLNTSIERTGVVLSCSENAGDNLVVPTMEEIDYYIHAVRNRVGSMRRISAMLGEAIDNVMAQLSKDMKPVLKTATELIMDTKISLPNIRSGR